MSNLKNRTVEIAGYCDEIDEQLLADERSRIANKYNIDPSEIRFELDKESIPYEDHETVVLNACFLSPKTEKELEDEAEKKERMNKSIEARDLKEYERLKSIYESKQK